MANEFDEWIAGLGVNIEATLTAIPGGAAVMTAVGDTAKGMMAGAPANGGAPNGSNGPGAPTTAAAQPGQLPGDEQAILNIFGESALRDYQQKKKESEAHARLPQDEKNFETAFGPEALHAFQQAKKQVLDRMHELAQAHETFVKTAKIPETKQTFAPIEIKLGISMTRAERYDAMLKSMHKQQSKVSGEDSDGIDDQDSTGPEDETDSTQDEDDMPDDVRKERYMRQPHFELGDVKDDNRDPDYLTKEEFSDEFWARHNAASQACDDDNIRPGTKDKCQRELDERDGGEQFKQWRDEKEARAAAAYRQYQERVENIANSGPVSLVGRGIGSIFSDKWADILGNVGGMMDTGLAIGSLSRSGSVEGAPEGAPLEEETVPHTAPPPENNPAETMPDRPGPRAVTDVEVIQANVKSPGSVRQQAPDAHQADWQAEGGTGRAPDAYRDATGTVHISTDHPLTKNTGVIPPVRTGGNQPPATPPAGGGGATAGGPKGGPGKPAADPADPWANTAPPPSPPPAPPATPAIDPHAKTGAPPPAKGPPGAGTNAANSQSQISQAPKPPSARPEKVIPPPQPVSEEAVERIRNQPPPPLAGPGVPKGRGSSVGFTEDHDAHELAWKRSGGHGESPPAFIYDNQVYLDKSRWPPKK